MSVQDIQVHKVVPVENTPLPSESTSEQSGRPRSEMPDRVTDPVQIIGFWLAVVLPFIHLPLLVGGLTSEGRQVLFMVLIALNLAAFYAGRNYRVE